ncbi:energy transducer TonB [Methylomonas sp. AM2-LC]|uniref:energy transducer TonB n=1 Tax=Methylomonas sp. AM2-LC TaxID=3153301 RepID=UPI0032676969
MIPQLCLLQFLAVANAPNRQSSAFSHARFSFRLKNALNYLGLIMAAVLHLVLLGLMDDAKPKQIDMPSTAIMVNWVSAPNIASSSPAIQAQPTSIKPNVEPIKNKSKATLPVSKPKSIIATNNEQESLMPVPISELPAPLSLDASEVDQAIATRADSNSIHTDNAPTSITLPNLNADYLDNPAPIYPTQSRRLGEQGKVLLRALINADGSVAQIILRKTSGHDRLDNVALETVKQWRFVPAKHADQAVAAWVLVPISFSLEG